MLFPRSLNEFDNRCIQVNYRVRPEAVQKLLPRYAEPCLLAGSAWAGIRLIPTRSPMGLLSRKARSSPMHLCVHWAAVVSRKQAHRQPPSNPLLHALRRDASTWWESWDSGWLQTPPHRAAQFNCRFTVDRIVLEVTSGDRQMHLLLEAESAAEFPPDCLLPAIREHLPLCGQMPDPFLSRQSLRTMPPGVGQLRVQPLNVLRLESSYFESGNRIPAGSVQFDCAWIETSCQRRWLPIPDLAAEADSQVQFAAT